MKLKYLLANKQTRLILLLTICVSVCITSIGLISYSKYRQVLDTELNIPNVELLQINLDVTNRAFRESDGKAVEASFHPATLEYIRSPSSDNAAKAAELQSYLKTLATAPDIHSIDVIKFADRSLLSSQYGHRAKWEDAPDCTWISWITDIEKKPLLVKRRLYGTGTETELGQTELLSLARPIVQDGQVGGAVMVNMDYDRLFSKMYTHVSNYQYVYNLEGELIYPKLNLPVPLSEMDNVIAALDVRPFAYVKVEGQDYMANQTFSDVTGWRLVSLVPTEQLLKNVKMARDMMLLLSLISILVGCSAMYYYNYAAFRPLKRINKLLNPGQKAVKRGDLHDLEPVIGKLVGDFQSKSLVAERSLPELRAKFILDIITHSIGSQEMKTKWEHYFRDWEPGPLAMIIVSIDRYRQWAATYLEEDQMLLKYALNNIILETLEPSWRTVSVAARKDGVAVMLQLKEPGAGLWAETLRRDAVRMIGMIKQYLNMSVSVSIGTAVPTILQVAQSYAEAKEALLFRLYKGYGGVQEYAFIEPVHEECTQPADELWKTEIANGIKASDGEACVNWIRRWAQNMRKKETHPHKVYRTVDDFLEEMLRIASAHSLTPPAELADYTWKQVTTMELAEIEDMLCRIVMQISDELGQRKQSKEYQLVREMIRFMESHLHRNIGLQDIAGHVNMGISSVSTIFKEETGSTVYDYLTKLRIDKACELLKDSRMKIADIASLVGYQNENSFIRAFRKNMSITPGKFRESSKYSGGYADLPKPRDSGIYEDST